MSGAPNRKDIIRIDCPTCAGNGYVTDQARVSSDNPDGQRPCAKCGGVGMLEKAMPYRAEGYDIKEAGAIFGVQNPTNRLLPGDPALDRNGGRGNEDDV